MVIATDSKGAENENKFKAPHTKTNTRRHCLVETGEKTFEFLPPGIPIVMQRLHVPTLEYKWSDPTKGDDAEKGVSNATVI